MGAEMAMNMNMTETEIGHAQYVDDNIFAERTKLASCVVVVSGPDKDGDICLLAGAETYLPPAIAARTALEILKRLNILPPALVVTMDKLWTEYQAATQQE